MTHESDFSRKIAGHSERYALEKRYWHERLSGEPELSSFPADVTPRDPNVFSEGKVEFTIDEPLFGRLMEICAGNDRTLHIVLAAAVTVLLYKYSGNRDILVGTPIYRQEANVDFINTKLVLRTGLDSRESFKECLMSMKRTVVEAVNHQNYPLPARYDVSLLLENIHEPDYLSGNRGNVCWAFRREDGLLRGTCIYNQLMYDGATIRRLTGHFANLLGQALGSLDSPLRELTILSANDCQLWLEAMDTINGDANENSSIIQLIHNHAVARPDRIAVIGATAESPNSLTYGELDLYSNLLALRLQERGVEKGALVAVMMERSLALIVGLLGILKTGAAYMPVSPDLPYNRKKYMIRDSNACLILAQPQSERDRDALVRDIVGLEVATLCDEDLVGGIQDPEADDLVSPADLEAGDCAYVIYTSGTTGHPKGVMVTHGGLFNYATWASHKYIGAEAVDFPLYTSISFDLTVTSIFVPLVSGRSIVVYPDHEKTLPIRRIIAENRVQAIKCTPAHLKLLVDHWNANLSQSPEAVDSTLKLFVVGGEALSAHLARSVLGHFPGGVAIYNEYGPTETVVGSMIYRFDPEADTGDWVPIGGPIRQTSISVFDGDMQWVPPNVSGELCIGGAGVASGYLNRPELTAGKFVTDPRGTGRLLYRSGDLAKIRPDGIVEYLGRMDQQLKIRGFRVEIGEIERTLKKYRRQPAVLSLLDEESIGGTPVAEKNRCGRCLLSVDFPAIVIDDSGVCDHCREFDRFRPHIERYFKTEEDFVQLTRQAGAGASSDYDCLLLYSGGKDSTYVLYRLIDYGLRVLAFTFDNGYISDAAFENIKKTTAALGVDHMTGHSDNMNKVFVESLRSQHNVCHGCWNALNTEGTRIAHLKGIPMVISGLSRGQIIDMRLNGLLKAGILDPLDMEEKLLLFRQGFFSSENRFMRIMNTPIPPDVVEKILFIDFFRYFPEPVQEIRDYLRQKGWIQPSDTGFCSSNCVINDAGIAVHQRGAGYHFYEEPLSWDVRLGIISRKQGLDEISFPPDLEKAERILTEIGYFAAPEVRDVVVLNNYDKNGNMVLTAFITADTRMTVMELREYLSGHLPDYMIPTYFVQMEEIPLTANGKVDRKKLMESSSGILDSGVAYTAPRSEREKAVAALFGRILKIEHIGVHDNLFSLGATSFDMIQAANLLNQELGIGAPVILLFEHPTIAGFLQHFQPESVEDTAEENKEWLSARQDGKDKLRLRRQKNRMEE